MLGDGKEYWPLSNTFALMPLPRRELLYVLGVTFILLISTFGLALAGFEHWAVMSGVLCAITILRILWDCAERVTPGLRHKQTAYD